MAGDTGDGLSPHEALRAQVDRLCEQMEALLEENRELDGAHQLPITEFTLNPRRLAALQDRLVHKEVSVVREVERTRLLKLLQCHHLKEAAWDNMAVKARSLFCICCDVSVRNYPVAVLRPGAWLAVVAVVRNRLCEIEALREAAKGETLSGRARKPGIWKKASIADDLKPSVDAEEPSTDAEKASIDAKKSSTDTEKPSTDAEKPSTDAEKPSMESGKSSTDTGKPMTDAAKIPLDAETHSVDEEQLPGGEGAVGESEDMELHLGEAEYRELLYPQLELTCRERVERQLVLIRFMMRRVQEAFNARFDAVHHRKGRVIEEVHRLSGKRHQLKEELARLRTEEGAKSRGHSASSSSREASEAAMTPTLLQKEDEDEEYEPSWVPEETPELMLEVHDSEVSREEWSDEGTREGVQGSRSVTDDHSPGTPTTHEAWTEARPFLSGSLPSQAETGETTTTPVFQTQRPREEWTWAEARAWREWQAGQEEEARRRRAHATTLSLQLERITPAITSLLQEFDSQVLSLVDARVSTDEALLLYQLVTVRLRHRLARQDHLNHTLTDLQLRRQQVEERVEQVESETENTRREEARARAKQERLQEQLKEEEVALKRAIINLPIDQYNYLLTFYSKRSLSCGRHLDLPSARGEGVSTPHTPSTPLSPATAASPAYTPERGGTRRGSARPSRPPSGASHSDDLRPLDDLRLGEETMPEGLAGGTRTWRQFLRYRRRRQDLLEEAEEAAAKRTSATAHLQVLDVRHQALLQEAMELEEEASSTSRDLMLLDEDMELVLILRSGQVKVDLDLTTETLQPEWSSTQLVQLEELQRLEATAEKCGDMERGGGGESVEVEALRTLRGQLQLEVELARQDLQQMNTFKVGRDVMAAATNAVGGGAQQDPSQLYASLQRLQKLHGEQAGGVEAVCSRLERKVGLSRRKVTGLQRQVDALAGEIDELQTQVALAQPEAQLAKRESRLRRVMACSELKAQVRRRQSTMLDLEQELDTLRLRTFPMLCRPPQTPRPSSRK
nr:cilia- and flagella-associated protein 43-like isoform X1 [Procambarus clarkii]